MRKENLYLLGEILPGDSRGIAIVGSRKMSEVGEGNAYKFSFYLAKAGLTIISGLARGIDTVAHKAALEAGGRTIAVLGSGLDIIYPPENKELARRIARQGVLISPFPLGTKPLPENFLARNKIIAHLALAVLVIEGARRSGTLSTAAQGANLGKDVFVIEGSEATNWLSAEGATVVKEPKDVLEYLGL